jgi:hypothetical protein
VSHFQTFGLEVLIFTANATKMKELRKGNRPFAIVGWPGGKRKMADLGVSGLTEHRNNKFITIY